MIASSSFSSSFSSSSSSANDAFSIAAEAGQRRLASIS